MAPCAPTLQPTLPVVVLGSSSHFVFVTGLVLCLLHPQRQPPVATNNTVGETKRRPAAADNTRTQPKEASSSKTHTFDGNGSNGSNAYSHTVRQVANRRHRANFKENTLDQPRPSQRSYISFIAGQHDCYRHFRRCCHARAEYVPTAEPSATIRVPLEMKYTCSPAEGAKNFFSLFLRPLLLRRWLYGEPQRTAHCLPRV